MPDVTSVPIKDLTVSPLNPRKEKKLDAIGLQELAASIAASGILQPLVVRRVAGKLEVVAGRRRLEAAILAGLTTVPCVEHALDDRQAASAGFAENEQRAALRPLDSALAVAKRLEAGEGLASIAAAVGKSVGWVARRANLLKLAPEVRKAFEDPESHIRTWPLQLVELLALLPAEEQVEEMDEAQYEMPTVASMKQRIARCGTELRSAPWKLDDAELVPKAGACSACPHNSANCGNLFGDLVPAGKKAPEARCLKQECWDQKRAAFAKRSIAAAEERHGKALVHVTDMDLAAGRVDQVKPGAKGASPAVIVDGSRQGEVLHVRKMSAGGAPAKASSPKQTPQSEAARARSEKEARKASIERLERRRQAWLVDQVSERIQKSAAPAQGIVLKLAAVFHVGHHVHERPSAGGSAGAILKAYESATVETLWRAMAKWNLIEPLKRYLADQLANQHRLACWMADLVFGAGTAAKLEQEAVEAVPAPKSLGGLKQTPAPKAAGKAAKSRKPAPAKRGRKA